VKAVIPAGANIKNNLHRRKRFKKEDFREELARPKSEGLYPRRANRLCPSVRDKGPR